MLDTQSQYETNDELKQMVCDSISSQIMVAHEKNIDQPLCTSSNTKFLVTGNRTLAEAQLWATPGQKVAVLNFANNHSIGGAPFSAGAQEESLCRCSTLFPCLEAMFDGFYKKHQKLFRERKIDHMGNDDLIYTPNVCVFKTEPLTDPIIPQLLPRDKWFHVDIITCAAPELRAGSMPSNYKEQLSSRIKKILDVAKMQGADVLILGAWGCGAFRNPIDVVANVFHSHLMHYDFQTVVFAMGGNNYKESPFFNEFGNSQQ